MHLQRMWLGVLGVWVVCGHQPKHSGNRSSRQRRLVATHCEFHLCVNKFWLVEEEAGVHRRHRHPPLFVRGCSAGGGAPSPTWGALLLGAAPKATLKS